jgi:hypothetical protein
MRTFARIADLVSVFPVVTTVFVPVMERAIKYRDVSLIIDFIDVNNLRLSGLYRGFLPGLFQLQFVPFKALPVHPLPLIFNRIIIVIESGLLRITLVHIDQGHLGSESFGRLVRIVSNTLVVDPFMYDCSLSRQQNKNHQQGQYSDKARSFHNVWTIQMADCSILVCFNFNQTTVQPLWRREPSRIFVSSPHVTTDNLKTSGATPVSIPRRGPQIGGRIEFRKRFRSR